MSGVNLPSLPGRVGPAEDSPERKHRHHPAQTDLQQKGCSGGWGQRPHAVPRGDERPAGGHATPDDHQHYHNRPSSFHSAQGDGHAHLCPLPLAIQPRPRRLRHPPPSRRPVPPAEAAAPAREGVQPEEGLDLKLQRAPFPGGPAHEARQRPRVARVPPPRPAEATPTPSAVTPSLSL